MLLDLTYGFNKTSFNSLQNSTTHVWGPLSLCEINAETLTLGDVSIATRPRRTARQRRAFPNLKSLPERASLPRAKSVLPRQSPSTILSAYLWHSTTSMRSRGAGFEKCGRMDERPSGSSYERRGVSVKNGQIGRAVTDGNDGRRRCGTQSDMESAALKS
jgi:hypothetical protein